MRAPNHQSNEISKLSLALSLPRNRRARTRLTFRIQRSMRSEAIVFALCGELVNEHTERLKQLLDVEKQTPIVLDLEQVTLVGREAVEFLARLEAEGVRIVNCPDYVRTWIDAENS